jgi:hypothetical protein
VPRLFGFSAQQDQVAAGAIMWVIGSLAFVIPAVLIAIHCLQRGQPELRPSIAGEPDGLIAISRRLPFFSRCLQRRSSSRSIEAISFVLLFAATGLCWAWLARSSGDNDDQVLKLREQSQAFEVSVFAPLGSLETGASIFNLLVQDRHTREVLPDAVIDLRAQPANDVKQTTSVRAAEGSENKLLQSAEVEFSSVGDWVLRIAINHNSDNASFTLPIHVVNSNGKRVYSWSYITFLAFAAILLLTYVRNHSSPKTDHTRLMAPESVPQGPGDHY